MCYKPRTDQFLTRKWRITIEKAIRKYKVLLYRHTLFYWVQTAKTIWMVGWSINLKCTSQKDKQNETSGTTQNSMDRCSYYKFINDRQKHVFYRLHIRKMDFDGNAGHG